SASDANAEDVEVYMVTPDKDFMQLVHDHVMMYKPDNQNGGFNLIGREEVKDYFGVYPEKVIDVLAILGDTSDNVPGVKGIGKKGAPKLINKYGTLEAAIEDAPNMSSKRHREGLQKYEEEALHAKEMVTIKTDVPETLPWEKLGWEGADREELGSFFKRMEFRTLTKKYLDEEITRSSKKNGREGPEEKSGRWRQDPEGWDEDEGSEAYDPGKGCYQLVNDSNELESLVDKLVGAGIRCFDTGPDGVHPMENCVVRVSLST